MPRTNVVLFGESGGGKSSIINMLSGGESVADTSSASKGCTFESRAFEVDIYGLPVTLWDTAGFSEDGVGRIPKLDAIAELYRLVRNLPDGISLLMFVMRAPRIKSSAPAHWKLLHKEEDMDQWWRSNKGAFQCHGINPNGFACVTAYRGQMRNGRYMFDEEYAESRDKVQNLIASTFLTTPWRVPAAQWFKTITIEIVEQDGMGWFWTIDVKRQVHREVAGEASEKLVSVCGMSQREAQELANKVRGT